MAESKDAAQENPKKVNLESGTYEVLKKRLQNNKTSLIETLKSLNNSRKEVFGSIETGLVATERISTAHNCIPWDMVEIGNNFLFGFNVHLGLKKEIDLKDVFSVHKYTDHTFPEAGLELLQDEPFITDFKKLYKYYKDTQFVKFAVIGPHLYMIFRIGKAVDDIKAFKWLIDGTTLKYLDNRSEHEFTFPEQHEFEWKRTSREYHRKGTHPHVSIEDKLFVETIGGNLTIKIEDNTDTGQGIYSEAVENADQTLDDAEILYAVIDNLILLKIKPYQEKEYRYIIYNSKLQEATAVKSIGNACRFLPDDQGILFPNGYYLQNGDYKLFDYQTDELIFEKSIASPNGEDYLYVFYNRHNGEYLLLPYNVIAQKIDNQIRCHGYALFNNGELCFFNSDNEPKKHHTAKIWQTPFTSADYEINTNSDSYLFKIGNKEIVKAMAECNELINLIEKGENYEDLYIDLRKLSTDIIDSYHWLDHAEAFNTLTILKQINQTAASAIDEFDKVLEIRKNTESNVKSVTQKADKLIRSIKRETHNSLEKYVKNLGAFRELRGETEALKNLRYVDEELVEDYLSKLKNENERLSEACVRFLLKDDALEEYQKKIDQTKKAITNADKVIDIEQTDTQIKEISHELELLIDIVSNLKIEDATQTTQIIDNISALFAILNRHQSELRRKRKELFLKEGKAEFNAQVKLIEQGATNYLELSETPKKCDEYLTKLMVQLEELEGKFAEFEDFTIKISEKREEIYNAFEAKKVNLIEAKNKRANILLQSAMRILNAAQSRAERLKTVAEINGYFSTDLMVEKLRNIINELQELDDTVKADDIQSRLKSLKEDAIRQLRDKTELYEDGKDVIKFGRYKFSVNTQPLEVTIVPRNNSLFFHLTGTNLYEEITDPRIQSKTALWQQNSPAENNLVYRSEYLAHKIVEYAEKGLSKEGIKSLSIAELLKLNPNELLKYVQDFMAQRYNEGYVKGVHDNDAVILLSALIKFYDNGGLLRFSSETRALAEFFWEYQLDSEKKKSLNNRIKGLGIIIEVFKNSTEYTQTIAELTALIKDSCSEIFPKSDYEESARYLFEEIKNHDDFLKSSDAITLVDEFKESLKAKKADKKFEHSIHSIKSTADRFKFISQWLQAFITHSDVKDFQDFIHEAACLLMHPKSNYRTFHIPLQESLRGMQGNHEVIQEGTYHINFNHFRKKLNYFEKEVVPAFEEFSSVKKELIKDFNEELRFNEFKPKIMSSFVRNKLINEVYLPLIGANLAKQIGEVGEAKRTDLMGMLLLISPPGYGKTTLMEYIANRLGVVFMKINGPAIGHQVTSVDPDEANNAASREELKKLNLAFEMGDNVMIYLDDIQHCNPEFLQKFISLCDAQRKIEGVYKGKSKTYHFRGKKVSVVMAGNPYTESGEKFRIPDMLSNRADIYNLGDIIGNAADTFKLSYLENCITSNPVLNKLAGKSLNDVYSLINAAEKDSLEGLDFETNHSKAEVNEYINVFKKLFTIRDIIVDVNQEYIKSAGQADEYRTEPAFKLQGSYRDMNKIAEKVYAVMNDKELSTLIESHYENEAQTLTSGAEANLLKFKELRGQLENPEEMRWKEIKEIFLKQQRLKGFGMGNQMGQMLIQIEEVTKGLDGIRAALMSPKN